VLFHRTLAGTVGMDPDRLGLIDPYVVRRSLWSMRIDKAAAGALPGEAVAGIAVLLQGRQIEDATAVAEAGELLAALGAKPDPAADRGQLLQQIQDAARTMAPDNAQAFAVAERIALAHSAGARGVRGADGRHLLVGLGDVASWVRSRLLDAAYFGYVAVWYRFPGYPTEKKFAERDQAFGAVLRTLLPDSLLAAQVAIGLTESGFANLDEPSPKAAAEALARAIVAERARPQPLGDQQLAWVVAKLAKRRPGLAQPIVAELLARWPQAEGAYARTGLRDLLRAAWRCEVDADLGAIAGAAARRAPADGTLHFNAEVFAPAVPLLDWTGLAPTATWVEPTPDARRNQFARVPHADRDFAVRWEGWLRIATPGRHRFQVVTNDYFKAVIGDLVLADPHQSVLHDDLAARAQAQGPDWVSGWQPLTIDFEHRGNDPEFRLLWQPPGASGFAPIPAELLAHGPEHAPGLAARALEARRAALAFEQLTGEPPETFAWVAGMPWRADLHLNLGTAATSHRQYSRLQPLLRAARAINPAQGAGHLVSCLLMGTGKDIDEGLALMAKEGFWRGDLPEQRLLVSHLRDQGRLGDFAALHAKQSDPRGRSYLRILCGLVGGRFAEIQPRMDEVFGDISHWTARSDLRACCLLTIAVHRMCGQPPPGFARLREMAGIPTDQGYRAALACLDGVSDPQSVAALAPWDRDLVRWAEALLELSEGGHAKAQPILAALAGDPAGDPGIAELARDLLAWYATQTPESLATVPRAAPLKRAKVVLSKPGVDDF
jgi:hypothetical protein